MKQDELIELSDSELRIKMHQGLESLQKLISSGSSIKQNWEVVLGITNICGELKMRETLAKNKESGK